MIFIKNDKVLIKGSKFDATNLAKYLNIQSKKNVFQNIAMILKLILRLLKFQCLKTKL